MFAGKVSIARPSKLQRLGRANAFTARPYTVRKGDTLSSIARKRGLELNDVAKMNYGIDPDNLQEGQTLLLPGGALSERDREILAGVGREYRTYPVRKGESLEDILSKRKITLTEFQTLNPNVNIDKLEENQIIKLPSNKYTVREREMLTGTGIMPADFFESGNATYLGIGALVGAAAMVGVGWASRNRKDE